jgi:hypothetical protein
MLAHCGRKRPSIAQLHDLASRFFDRAVMFDGVPIAVDDSAKSCSTIRGSTSPSALASGT